MHKQRNSQQAGFTLLELLVVLCIIICLLALLWPKLWPLVLKSRETKTLADCKAVSDAFAMYVELHGGTLNSGNPVNLSDYGTLHPNTDVAQFLTPDFIKLIPATDAWGRPFEYYYQTGSGPLPFAPNVAGPHVFLIRSLGQDGVPDGSSYVPGTFIPNLQNGNPGFQGDDIVCADGEVIRWPGPWQ